jgi:hypothetical protein
MLSAFEQYRGLIRCMVLSEQTHNKQYNAHINNIAGVVVPMSTYIREMPGFNCSQVISCPRWGFFPCHFPPGRHWVIIPTKPWKIPYKSFIFHCPPYIWHYRPAESLQGPWNYPQSRKTIKPFTCTTCWVDLTDLHQYITVCSFLPNKTWPTSDTVFTNVTPCSLVYRYHHTRHSTWRQHVPLNYSA